MRTWLRCLAAMAVLASAGAGEAQVAAAIAATEPYPSRPVRVIVPFGAGGPGDLFARLIAQQLGENLGKAFYIENHPGAAGNIGTALAARAPADGYTLVVVSSTFMINATLYPKLPYDPIKDFDPITIAATTPNVVMVNPSVPANTVAELVALIRAGKYTNYAMGGTGTPSHLSAELFRLARIMAAPAVRARMLAIGFEPVVTTPDDFAARIRSEIPRWGKIIREANIRPE